MCNSCSRQRLTLSEKGAAETQATGADDAPRRVCFLCFQKAMAAELEARKRSISPPMARSTMRTTMNSDTSEPLHTPRLTPRRSRALSFETTRRARAVSFADPTDGQGGTDEPASTPALATPSQRPSAKEPPSTPTPPASPAPQERSEDSRTPLPPMPVLTFDAFDDPPDPAESWLRAYRDERQGMEPKTAEQLRVFARNRGGTLTFAEARDCLAALRNRSKSLPTGEEARARVASNVMRRMGSLLIPMPQQRASAPDVYASLSITSDEGADVPGRPASPAEPEEVDAEDACRGERDGSDGEMDGPICLDDLGVIVEVEMASRFKVVQRDPINEDDSLFYLACRYIRVVQGGGGVPDEGRILMSVKDGHAR